MRPASACDECRNRRKKCVRPDLTGSCFSCIKRGVACTLEEPSSSSLTSVLTLGAPNYELLYECREDAGFRFTTTLLIEYELAEELVEIYFAYIHVAFHNIFHQPSVEAALSKGTLPKVLLLCIASLSARFSSSPFLSDVTPRERGLLYRKQAEKLIDFHSLSLTTIQACLMVAAISIIQADASSEAVFLSVACRMALIMDLPNARVRSLLDQEVCIRVWWSLIATDTWSSGMHQIPKAMPVRPDVRKPMDEESFASLSPEESAQGPAQAIIPVSASQPSILAYMIELNQLLHQILMFSQDGLLASSEIEITSGTGSLCAALDTWYDRLPERLQYTAENHTWWMEQRNGRKFTIMHINYNYAAQLLFLRFLYICQDRPDIPAADLRRTYAARSKEHSARLCDLIHEHNEGSGIDVQYPLVAHVLVVASITQLFILLFSSDDAEIGVAKLRLERTFERLTVLQQYWPNLDASIAKFRAFHLECQEGKLDTFRMDEWLVQFMIDYSRPSAERVQ